MGADPHWLHEHAIFLRFLDAAPALNVARDSIRRGEGYDIACTTTAGETLACELTEVTDANWAAALARIMEAAALMNQRLEVAQDETTNAVRVRYWERDIKVTLAPRAGMRALRRVLDRLFAWLASVDPGVIGNMRPPGDLVGTVVGVEARHFPGIKGLCFHVPGEAVWIDDPSVAAVHAKFEKDYPGGIGLQLLAYFHRQPARPGAAAKVRAYLEAVMPDDSFSAAWLYDDLGRALLLRHP